MMTTIDTTYLFLQNYWWFLVSLLGAILVFPAFVQGGNSLLFSRTFEWNVPCWSIQPAGNGSLPSQLLLTFGGLSLLRFLCFIVPVSEVLTGYG